MQKGIDDSSGPLYNRKSRQVLKQFLKHYSEVAQW